MLNKIKKVLFKQTSNQRGSVLSVSLIVVALLSFSIATITSNSVNLSGSTTEIQENVENTNYAKKLINMALEDTKEFIQTNPSTDPIVNYFNNDMDTLMYERYQVIIEDHTLELGLNADVQAALYFQYVFEDGTSISRYTYYLLDPNSSGITGGTGNDALAEILDDPATQGGMAEFPVDGDIWEIIDWFFDWIINGPSNNNPDDGFDASNPYEVNFYFSMVTNGDMYLNGGLYDLPSLYAKNIYSGKTSAYLHDDNWQITPSSFGEYPDFSAQDTKIFIDDQYQYCQSNCMTVTNNGDTVEIDKSVYQSIETSGLNDYGDIQPYLLANFFENYDYNENLIYFLESQAPTGSNTLVDVLTDADIDSETPLVSLLDYAEEMDITEHSYWDWVRRPGEGWSYEEITYYSYDYPDSMFVEVANTYDFSDLFMSSGRIYPDASIIYNGDLILNDSLLLDDTDTLIVLGDLTIDMSSDGWIEANIVVTGDVTFIGRSVNYEGTLIALGETIINFDNYEGFYNFSQFPKNFTLLSKDNIRIYRLDASNSSYDQNRDTFQAFFYTEESILIDAVNSNINIEGSMYARAKGDTKNPLPFIDAETLLPIEGMIINSVMGYHDGDGNIYPYGSWAVDSYTRFQLSNINRNHDQEDFMNLPYFQVSVVGDAVFVDDEYVIE